jgi:MFS family permease
MRPREVAGIILASALVTFDGTATTIALPALGQALSASVLRLQWIANAPLLALASLLLPAGMLADRYGRVRMIRVGLCLFVAASVSSAAAPSAVFLIAAKFVQGAGAALILPAALATLRGAYTEAVERARMFGIWAAWTGVASAAGPLLAGAFVDVWSWRAVFLPSAAAGALAIVLLQREVSSQAVRSTARVPVVATIALALSLGSVAYLLTQGFAVTVGRAWLVLAALVAVAGGVFFARHRDVHVLIPKQLLSARNCLPANATTAALYFGMFGLSFLLVLYAQQVLHYSALWAALLLLPMSVMLFFAERFSRLTALTGAQRLIVAGTLSAAAAIAWLGATGHPLRWPHMILATGLFGLGTSFAVSALTHAAVAAVPETCAGAASGLNHAVVRVAGLGAVALLGSIAAPGATDVVSAEGVQRALLTCSAIVAAGGLLGSALLRDDEPGGLTGGAADREAPPTIADGNGRGRCAGGDVDH